MYWCVLWWCILGCGDVFWCLRCRNVLSVLVRCVHVLVCYGYLFFLGVNQMYWYVLWRYRVCSGDVIMFVVVKCKLISAKMRYLFILFIMCNTDFFIEATRNWMHSKLIVKSDRFTPLQQFKLFIIVMRRIPNYEYFYRNVCNYVNIYETSLKIVF